MTQDPYMAPGSSTEQYERWDEGWPEEPDPPERRCMVCDRLIDYLGLCEECRTEEEPAHMRGGNGPL